MAVPAGSAELMPLLHYWFTLRVKKVLMFCNFFALAVTAIFFLIWKKKFHEFCHNMVQTKRLLIAWLNLSIIHQSLSKIRYWNKSACPKSNPVQNSRSKSTISPRVEYLLSDSFSICVWAFNLKWKHRKQKMIQVCCIWQFIYSRHWLVLESHWSGASNMGQNPAGY